MSDFAGALFSGIPHGYCFQWRPDLVIAHVSADAVIAASLLPDGSLQIEVADEGIGFYEKHSKLIFEPFKRLNTRAEYAGSGIGLAICKTLCDRHEWAIFVHSTPDVGTKFSILMPKNAKAHGAAAAPISANTLISAVR